MSCAQICEIFPPASALLFPACEIDASWPSSPPRGNDTGDLRGCVHGRSACDAFAWRAFPSSGKSFRASGVAEREDLLVRPRIVSLKPHDKLSSSRSCHTYPRLVGSAGAIGTLNMTV